MKILKRYTWKVIKESHMKISLKIISKKALKKRCPFHNDACVSIMHVNVVSLKFLDLL